MKRLLPIAVIVAVALAVPASSHGSVDRKVATQPDTGGQAQGYHRAWRFNPSANYQTWVSACCFVPDISKPWYSVGRPTSDLYAAGYGANHFWPGCSHEWYGSVDDRVATGWYYTYYHISC